MNPAVGIDLGTTNTVVAIQTDSTGPQLLLIPQPNYERREREPLDYIKSAVLFESKGSAVVGSFAFRRPDSEHSIKSRMGTRWKIPHPYDSENYLTPPYISAHILKTAYNQLVDQFPEWNREAIITVPASFNTDQRNDTLLAAKMAGFSKVRLLDEPTAAFYYYFDQNRDSIDIDGTRTVLVFDFGGGTLDVSIIQLAIFNDQICIDAIGRSRYNNLGGDDIDLDLAAFLFAIWKDSYLEDICSLDRNLRRNMYKLFIQKASEFKEEVEDYLSNDLDLNDFVVNETITYGNKEIHVEINKFLSQPQYEEITGRYFSNKGDINIFRPIGQALEVAAELSPGFKKNDIDMILYTGGASRMNGVKAALNAYFRPIPCYSISDEEACNTVALGAACCRYDELNRQREVTMTVRLLESILTRDDEGRNFITLVPLTCVPSKDFTEVPHVFKTGRPLINMKIPLFRGIGPHDHNLNPMQDLELRLPMLIEANVNYRLFYRMTDNKTVELRAEFELENETLEVESEVSIDSGKLNEIVNHLPVCEINK